MTLGPAGWLALLALLAAGGLAAACALLWRRHRAAADELRAVRVRSHALADLLDVWQWHSNDAHELTLLRPPQGADHATWTSWVV